MERLTGGEGHPSPTLIWHSGNIDAALQQLRITGAATLQRSLAELAQPAALPNQASHFSTLSLDAQAMTLLLLRAAPEKFPRQETDALLRVVSEGGRSTAQLTQALVGMVEPPACPDFLYTSAPAFPWAPVLCAPAQADALLAQQRQQHQLSDSSARLKRTSEPRAGPVTGAKRQHIEAALHDACELIKSELGQTQLNLLSPACGAALDVVLAHLPSAEVMARSGLGDLADDALLVVVNEVVTASTSYSRCCAVAQGIVLPALQGLQGSPGRGLTAAVEHLCCCNPAAILNACFGPMLASEPALSKARAELIVKVAKSALPVQLLPGLIEAACTSGSQGSTPDATAAGAQWTEHTVTVLQAVLDAKVAIADAALLALVCALHGASRSPALRASVKLGKLLLTVGKGQGRRLGKEGRAQLRAAAAATTTFMSKPTLAALDKLET